MSVKRRDHSHELFTRAQQVMPGGVSSPVRAFKGVSGEPIFIERAEGSKLYDADGNEYIDYVASFGPLILGHSHPRIIEALSKALPRGTSYGAPTELEINLAEKITSALPAIEKIRFVNSGTEATMSALRLARAFAKRDKILKFDGCYHGHADMLLVQAGSGVATLGLPDSPGVPKGATAETLSAPFNDLDSVKNIFDDFAGQIAAVIVEPVAGNMGVVPPTPGFLSGLREMTHQHKSLLIMDEIITGFRLGWGGAQEMYDIKPDLICLGKIIGGGLPVGAYGGRTEIMDMVAPIGPVYQAGTLAGNPLAMTAGIAMLETLQECDYAQLESCAKRLADGLLRASRSAGVPIQLNRVGSMLTPFFTTDEVTDYSSAKRSDTKRYAKFFHEMLNQGIYLPPSQFEAWFVSFAHSSHEIDQTLEAAHQALKVVAT
jgi:glutamate-1-semialdehyde 2,1-aminomutase